ncbi:MAG: hypothetical protein ACRC62_31490 [Microcoleus sp.]
MATKGSDKFPKGAAGIGDVTQAELDRVSSDLTDMITALETGINELKNKDPDVTQAELDKSVEDAQKMIKAVEDAIAELKAKAPDVTKAELTAAVEELETSIAALPTSDQLDAVKADVTAVQDKLTDLDTDKADKAAVEAANTAIKDVDTALKALAALPPDVSQSELDAAIADYTAKLKTADDAISAANQSILSITPVGYGKTLDLTSIKVTGSGFWNGASLAGGPSNGGSGGSGRWAYSGDATTGTMEITIWTAPTLRQIEGGWVRSRTAGNWGDWGLAPKAGDFQVTTGNRTVFTAENWTVGDGHVVTLNYLDVSKTIKLKPATDWTKVPQPIGNPFTVSAKPTSGNEVVEYKFNQGRGNWDIIPPVADPLVTRITAVETLNTAQNARLDALEGKNYDLEAFALDAGRLFTAAEAIGTLSLVHVKTDGTIELASDAVQDKRADGIVLGAIAIGATGKVYGTGSRIADVGLTTVSNGSRIYLGPGEASLSSSGTGRFIQDIGVFWNGFYRLRFDDPGYWIS